MTLDVPTGWSAGTAHATVPAFGRTTVQVPLTAGDIPEAATVRTKVTGQDGAAVNGAATVQVLSAPRGDQVPLALDAGTPTSPVFSTYRLSPPTPGTPPEGTGGSARRRSPAIAAAPTTCAVTS